MVSILCGYMPQYDHGLGKVVKVVVETLAELGIETEELHLGFEPVPFYDGIASDAAEDIAARLRESSGVVFACSSHMFAPSAAMQSFIDYMQSDTLSDVLREKQCFLIVASKDGGERAALGYLGKVVGHMGGYEAAVLGLQETHTRSLDEGSETRVIVEKETEDYYRSLRQNRKRIIPRDSAARERIADFASADVPATPKRESKRDRVQVSDVYEKLNLDSFTEQQERDIEELSRFFAEKYADSDTEDNSEPEIPVQVRQAPKQERQVTPREKTLRQATQSLPHYFQPQLSGGLTAVIQINVTGDESFEGYLTIRNVECEYAEGLSESPDITILSDSTIWRDVLRRHYTAQKAFMIGGLKVRGNFVLLTKFDSLFKLPGI